MPIYQSRQFCNPVGHRAFACPYSSSKESRLSLPLDLAHDGRSKLNHLTEFFVRHLSIDWSRSAVLTTLLQADGRLGFFGHLIRVGGVRSNLFQALRVFRIPLGGT